MINTDTRINVRRFMIFLFDMASELFPDKQNTYCGTGRYSENRCYHIIVFLLVCNAKLA